MVDPENVMATLWMALGVAVPVVLLYGAVLLNIGSETLLDNVLAIGIVAVSMLWMTYCTWQIRQVSVSRTSDAEVTRH